MGKVTKISVIDLFAGPGGLGEGFSALSGNDGGPVFRVCLSIEKEPRAHETLLLRAFFRQFESLKVPKDYYKVLRGELTPETLFANHAASAAAAAREAWHAVYLNAKDKAGKVENWAVETGAPLQLVRRGGDKKSLAVGTDLIVDGWLARDGSKTVNGRTIKFGDGREILAGSSNNAAQ